MLYCNIDKGNINVELIINFGIVKMMLYDVFKII